MKVVEVGKYYKISVDNYEDPVIVKCIALSRKPSHCKTCTCVDNRTQFEYISGPPAVGNINTEVLEEVKKPNL